MFSTSRNSLAYTVRQEQPTVIKFLLLGSPSLPFCSTSFVYTSEMPRSPAYCNSILSQERKLKADQSLDILISVSHLLSTLAVKSGSFVELSRRPVFTQGQVCLGALGLVCLFLKLHSGFSCISESGLRATVPYWAPHTVKVRLFSHASGTSEPIQLYSGEPFEDLRELRKVWSPASLVYCLTGHGCK